MVYIMIRKAVEEAIGLRNECATEKLLSTGFYNTVEKVILGHLSTQKLRIRRTAAGRSIFHQIGWAAQNVTPLDALLGFWR